MQFENLIKNLLKENQNLREDDPVALGIVTELPLQPKVLNSSDIISIIKKDIEDEWEIFKGKHRDRFASKEEKGEITPDQEKHILSLYKDFMPMFSANMVVGLKTSQYGDYFYKGKLKDVKIKIQETNIKVVDNDTSKPIIGYSGFAVFDFPSKEKTENLYLIPLCEQWSSTNKMYLELNPWNGIEVNDVNINWIYSFQNKNYDNIVEFNPITIEKKRFDLDNIPESIYDMIFEYSGNDSPYQLSGSKGAAKKREIEDALKPYTETQFEDSLRNYEKIKDIF